MLLLPVQKYFSFLPLFNGTLTGPIGATFGGIATPLLLLAGILILFEAVRERRQATLVQQSALATDKEKVHAEVATRYILELFTLFKQENDKFSPEEVEKALKTISDTHQNYHNGQIAPLIFTSHLRYLLNTSAVGQHLHHIARLLTHLIKVVRSKQAVLSAEDYGLMLSFLDGFHTAIFPQLKALVQLNQTCDLCGTNPYEYFGGKDQIRALNKALASINIKPYKL
ncbi:hypothetical protein AAE02nite_51380 [Adhaeribacter aerolatus]|uniref:Uncharacterized protein n=1 Tax=Adhaeribacter aerolatus TaxID=670289 RepID=A0A512B685_9BACT|nr:hypothetical protein [Adhaeribacter aerolatus]GEO07474.1 hypothetical protein AAE02nite_51380 [Adhaeribacter aerolatus]